MNIIKWLTSLRWENGKKPAALLPGRCPVCKRKMYLVRDYLNKSKLTWICKNHGEEELMRFVYEK